MRKDILLPALAVVGGGAGFMLRRWQLSAAFDEMTLLFREGAASTSALLAVLAVCAVLLLALVFRTAYKGSCDQAFFCPGTGYMTMMTAGGFLFLAAAVLGVLEMREQILYWQMQVGVPFPVMNLISAVLCIPAGVGVLLAGKSNYRRSLPRYYPVLLTLPAYAMLPWVVALYQANSRQPALMLFALSMLGVVCAELGFYFAANFGFARPRPRLCLWFSLMGVVLLLTSLADRPSRFFAVLELACILVLLAQSRALLRTCWGPAWPEAEEEPEHPEEH